MTQSIEGWSAKIAALEERSRPLNSAEERRLLVLKACQKAEDLKNGVLVEPAARQPAASTPPRIVLTTSIPIASTSSLLLAGARAAPASFFVLQVLQSVKNFLKSGGVCYDLYEKRGASEIAFNDVKAISLQQSVFQFSMVQIVKIRTVMQKNTGPAPEPPNPERAPASESAEWVFFQQARSKGTRVDWGLVDVELTRAIPLGIFDSNLCYDFEFRLSQRVEVAMPGQSVSSLLQTTSPEDRYPSSTLRINSTLELSLFYR